jgi:hypothetical protein
MAFKQGRFSEITVSGVNLSTYCDTIDLSRDTEMLETTTFTKTSKTWLTGLQDAKVDIKGKYDPTVTTGPQAVLNNLVGASNSVWVKYFPGGNAAGQRINEFYAFVTNYSESSNVGDVVAFSASLQIDGPVFASGI